MTVTRGGSRDQERPQSLSPTVIRGLHAVRGVLLALAATVTAVTGLIMALMHR